MSHSSRSIPAVDEINVGAPQLACVPAETDDPVHPTWDAVLTHTFSDLNEALTRNPWAQANGITTGREYGMLWCACLIREPFQPLPYLFAYGRRNSGQVDVS